MSLTQSASNIKHLNRLLSSSLCSFHQSSGTPSCPLMIKNLTHSFTSRINWCQVGEWTLIIEECPTPAPDFSIINMLNTSRHMSHYYTHSTGAMIFQLLPLCQSARQQGGKIKISLTSKCSLFQSNWEVDRLIWNWWKYTKTAEQQSSYFTKLAFLFVLVKKELLIFTPLDQSENHTQLFLGPWTQLAWFHRLLQGLSID